MRELSLATKQMTEYKMTATTKAADIGIGLWREIVHCFITLYDIERDSFTLLGMLDRS